MEKKKSHDFCTDFPQNCIHTFYNQLYLLYVLSILFSILNSFPMYLSYPLISLGEFGEKSTAVKYTLFSHRLLFIWIFSLPASNVLLTSSMLQFHIYVDFHSPYCGYIIHLHDVHKIQLCVLSQRYYRLQVMVILPITAYQKGINQRGVRCEVWYVKLLLPLLL